MTATAYRSIAANPEARDQAAAAHRALLASTPTPAEARLVDRLRSKDAFLAMTGPFLLRGMTGQESDELVDEMRETVRMQRFETLCCLALVALPDRGFDPNKIAPVDYPALAEALVAEL